MNKRALITGGTGFVGANLARHLLRQGHKVDLLVRLEHSDWRIKEIAEEAGINVCSLSDSAGLRKVMQRVKPDWIFHLAVYGAYPSQTDWRLMVETNILGTSNLLDAAREVGFEAFVNSGSSSEYGYKSHAPSEHEYVEPNSDYAVSKVAATLHCGLVGQSANLPVCTLRLYSVYGPFEEPTRFMPVLAVNALRGRLPALADPSIARDYVYVDDVVDAFIAAAMNANECKGQVFNVGTGTQTTLSEAVAIARDAFRIADVPSWGSMPNRLWDTSVWVSDNRKIVDNLGWKPRRGLAEGFRALAEWLRSDPQRLAYYESRSRL